MWGSAPGSTDASNRLSFGLPSTTTGPSSAPLSNCSRVSNDRPPFCLVSPWHERHSSRRRVTALRARRSADAARDQGEVVASANTRTEARRAADQDPVRRWMRWLTVIEESTELNPLLAQRQP